MAAATPRKAFIGGNWKCNGTLASVKDFVGVLNKGAGSFPSNAEVVVAPLIIYLGFVLSTLTNDISVAIQNIIHKRGFGAYTGEITPAMAKDFGVQWTLVGHSERRHVVAHESDAIVRQKVEEVFYAGLNVILCLGETLEQRDSEATRNVVLTQLSEATKGLAPSLWDRLVVAYEPVWVIGTGRVVSPETAQEVHQWLRAWIDVNVSPAVAASTRIIYGGSVKPANCTSLWKQKDIDGFFVGGASLKPDFLEIVACVKAAAI